jgi:hypothetical protein
MNMRLSILCLLAALTFQQAIAQEKTHRLNHWVDSVLTIGYFKGDIDTAYVTRPKTKWTLAGRLNVSGAKLESLGVTEGQRFNAEITANHKATLSVGVSYLGFSLSAAINPAKLMGKYRDFELNFNSYGRHFGYDIIFQDAHNFTGWHDMDGMERIYLPADMLSVRTLNVNAFYIFNGRRFSFPAAFTQSYFQRRSAGSFLVAVSGMGQHTTLKWEQETQIKMTNIGIGGGYGYNYVPSQDWLLHISATPTFIVYSNTSMTFGNARVPLHYHFPEAIITGRGAVVRQLGNKFFGMSMVFNFTNIGNEEDLALHNIKWRIRMFYGLRL